MKRLLMVVPFTSKTPISLSNNVPGSSGRKPGSPPAPAPEVRRREEVRNSYGLYKLHLAVGRAVLARAVHRLRAAGESLASSRRGAHEAKSAKRGAKRVCT